MSVELEHPVTAASEAHLQYRALHSPAVVSLVLGVLSATALLDWFFTFVPVLGAIAGIVAWRQIQSRPEVLSGLGVAKAGVALSLFFLIAGVSWLSYSYAAELPPGYERIDYSMLQPDPTVSDEPIPPTAMALEGKRIFIKGYVYPGKETEGIKTFLLVRDQGECCFGGDPKITDRIQVTLRDPLRLRFSPRLHKVAGTFRVRHASKAVNGPGGIYYQLDADYLR